MTENQAVLKVRPFLGQDTQAVVALWRVCGLVTPWNDPCKDIERKLKVMPELFLVGCLEGAIVATVMAGYDGRRGWMNYVAVAPHRRKQGIGRQMADEAQTRLRALGCPKINLMVRTGNSGALAFYQRLGFVRDDVVCLGKRLEKDEPA